MREHHHHSCHEHGGYTPGAYGRGAAMFYGYCHETGRMRMMDYPDYMSNLQTGYQNMYKNMTSSLQSYLDAMQNWPRGGHHKGCGCGCGGSGHHRDCHCNCCIKCADAVEYVRCGEIRNIPITLENDTRKERDVKLQLGAFATAAGKELEWPAALSETAFKLGPCSEKTVILRVLVDCSKFDTPATPPGGTGTPGTGTTGTPAPGATAAGAPAANTGAATSIGTEPIGVVGRGGASVDECKVAYATLRAEGCTVRPIVIAVAVLPNDCGSHHAGCQCGCCC